MNKRWPAHSEPFALLDSQEIDYLRNWSFPEYDREPQRTKANKIHGQYAETPANQKQWLVFRRPLKNSLGNKFALGRRSRSSGWAERKSKRPEVPRSSPWLALSVLHVSAWMLPPQISFSAYTTFRVSPAPVPSPASSICSFIVPTTLFIPVYLLPTLDHKLHGFCPLLLHPQHLTQCLVK